MSSCFEAETPRLRLRRLRSADAAFLLELLNQRSWIEFIGDRDVHTTEEASDYLARRMDSQFDRYGYGMWGAELREGQRLIGLAGLVKRDYLPVPDLGFALLDSYVRQGFAREAAEAVLTVARRLKLQQLLAITVQTNQRSIGLLHRLGFELDGPQEVPGEHAPVQRYSRDLG